MSSSFDLIAEDFSEALMSIDSLLKSGDVPGQAPRTRIALIQSSILLLGATFEETVRQLAKEAAKAKVSESKRIEDLPKKLGEVLWRRATDGLAKIGVGKDGKPESLAQALKESRSFFDTVHGFLGGSLENDIYDVLIHNENNMRYNQINSLFAVCGISSICNSACTVAKLKTHYGISDAGKVDGQFSKDIDEFFQLRNAVAHSLNATSSVSSSTVAAAAEMMRAFVLDLAGFLSVKFQPVTS